MTKRLAVLIILAATTLTACGKDDELPASSGDPTTTSSTAATATTSAATASVSLTATEYVYEGTNLAFPAGDLSVTLVNKGKEEHQATIVRLKDGTTLDEFAAVAGGDPSKLDTVADAFGGPNGVAPDGGSATSTQSLEAGDYFFMCFIPAPDGQPHAAKGMVTPFKVEGEAAGASAPADKQIVLKEYGFGFGDDALLEAGTYTFKNEGQQLHEAAVYAPADGKTAQDVIDFFGNPNPPAGPPPFVSSGGISATNPGTGVTAELTTGEYVFICFIPDQADGAPHFAKGMIQAVSVD